MYHLIYLSSSVHFFNDDQLKELLETSRRNNSASEITGMLLYLEGNFIQVLEGEKDSVLKTHDRIANDPRHTGLLTVLQGEISTREFSNWSMGFKKMDSESGDSLIGYNDFLRKGIDKAEKKTAALRLLESFKVINR